MQLVTRAPAGVLILVGMLLSACAQPTVDAAPAEAIHLEPVEGTELSRITLIESAAERLDIQTVPVDGPADGPGTSVPYAAVVYDASGQAWVYTNPEPLVYVRHAIEIESVGADVATLSDGPSAGTEVVIVGLAELYGAEQGVGGGH